MMSYTIEHGDAYKNFAEVFTPPGVVFQMVLQDGIREIVQDVDKTMFDPCVGEGQFPCAELVLKMFYAIDKLDENTAVRALASLHGVDIQESSVEKTIVHMSDTLCAAYKFFTGKEFTAATDAADIICKNFIVGDSLKLMKKWTNPRQSLFD